MDFVNLYGYMIGEQVFTMREFGLAEDLSKLPGNHPYKFVLATLKGFNKAIENEGSSTFKDEEYMQLISQSLIPYWNTENQEFKHG